MDDKFYKEILEENKAAVKNKVKEAMLEGISSHLAWQVPDKIGEIVSKFIKDEISPAIRAELLENKDEIVSAATDIIRGIPAELGKALQSHLAERLTDRWKFKEITKAMFQ